MKPFNKKDAELYISKLLKKHKIEVYARSSTSSGRAKIKKRMIKIPNPTNVDKFAVCLHEIFHIISRKGSKSFEKEFYCDQYARNILIELGYPVEAWDKRTKWHVLSRIAMAHNRGLNHINIKSDIRAFFPEIDFTKWIGKKVFVGYKYARSIDPADIELTKSIPYEQVKLHLEKKGLKIIKSLYDDSTYGNYIVSRLKDHEKHGEEFESLRGVIAKYNL